MPDYRNWVLTASGSPRVVLRTPCHNPPRTGSFSTSLRHLCRQSSENFREPSKSASPVRRIDTVMSASSSDTVNSNVDKMEEKVNAKHKSTSLMPSRILTRQLSDPEKVGLRFRAISRADLTQCSLLILASLPYSPTKPWPNLACLFTVFRLSIHVPIYAPSFQKQSNPRHATACADHGMRSGWPYEASAQRHSLSDQGIRACRRASLRAIWLVSETRGLLEQTASSVLTHTV